MKSETSFRVFFLKQHRKNSLKNIFSHQEVYFWISAFDYWAIVLPKMHIVQWRISYEFLDFGALAIIISLFGKADRQVKETNDRGSDQLVEHVSVKQLP